MPDTSRLAAELAAIRERARDITDEHGPGDCDLNGDTCTGHDAERLLAAVEAALALHCEFRVYQECGHQHAYDSDARQDRDQVIDCGDFVTCQDGYMYTACRECCTVSDAGGHRMHAEECAGAHDHAEGRPVCPTVAAITRALTGEDGSS